jgi:hypothetical protein
VLVLLTRSKKRKKKKHTELLKEKHPLGDTNNEGKNVEARKKKT